MVRGSRVAGRGVGHVAGLFGAGGGKVLSIFFATKCPGLSSAGGVLGRLRGGKVSVMRVNVPFSSPVTSNPIVRRTSATTLQGKVSLRILFRRLRSVHRSIRVPVVLVNCLGPVVRCNFRTFYQGYIRAKMSNVVVPSLPFTSCVTSCGTVISQCSLGVVVLVAPRASRRHVHLVSRRADNFVCVMSDTSAAKTRRDFGRRGRTCFRHVGKVKLQGPHLINFNVSGGTAFSTMTVGSSKTVVKDGFVRLLGDRPVSITISGLQTTVRR